MAQKTFRTCTLCEAMCGIVVESEADRVLSIRGDADDPFSRGHVCPKAVALKDLHEDPDRLKRPLVRDGAGFREVSWDEAFERVARGLRDVQSRHGRHAVAMYQGNPTVHNYGSLMYVPRFVHALRTKHRYSATSVDQLPHQFTSYLMYGHQALLPVPDIDRTDYFMMLGANPAVSNGSLMTAPGVSDRLKAIVARGGKVIVLDPRRSESAGLASEHHFIRPGSDALFLLAMLHVVLAEGRDRLSRLSAWVDGIEAVRELCEPFAPGRVAERIGIDAATIRRLAREFSAAERAVCYGRMGVSTQRFGALSCWLVNVLNVVTGNLDSVGGAMFTEPAVDLVKPPIPVGGRGHFARYRSRVRKLPEFGGELPVATLAEDMDTPGEGQIRALVTSAGNPVLSTPNGERLARALEKLEFMVSVDFYLNETTRHAHVILPPTGPLEHDHYDLVFHLLAVRNTAKYSPAVFPRPEGARHDWEIWNELAQRLEQRPLRRWLERGTSALLEKLGPRGLLDVLLRTGPRGDRYGLVREGLSVEVLERSPHGIDLGPLRPCLKGRLQTANRKLQLAPELLVRDVERLERSLSEAAPARHELVLIGRRQLRSNNSWLHNSQRLVKGPVRCTLEMHPEDARALGLSEGQDVEIRSRVGSVVAPVSLRDSLMRGVVSLPHGWGHHRPGTRLGVAERHAGVSINDLTDELVIDELCGNASFSGLSVSVRPVLHEGPRPSEPARAGS